MSHLPPSSLIDELCERVYEVAEKSLTEGDRGAKRVQMAKTFLLHLFLKLLLCFSPSVPWKEIKGTGFYDLEDSLIIFAMKYHK